MDDRTPEDAGNSPPEAASRAARLKAALRANLGRRKRQARNLGAGTAAPAGTGAREDQQ